MIGKKVRVFWPVDNSWYTGTVQQYDIGTGEHLLKYDDGDTEWVKIGENCSGGISSSSGLARSTSPEEGPVNLDPMPPLSPTSHPDVMGKVDVGPPGGYPPFSNYPPPVDSSDTKWYGDPAMGVPYPGYHATMYLPPPPHPAMGYYPSPQYPPPYGYSPPMPVPSGGPAPTSGPDKPQRVMNEPVTSPSASSKRKAGPTAWTKEEDARLLSIVQNMRMPMKWSIVAQSLTDRTGKQCRERYVNHLNPRLKFSDWSPLEDATIFHLYNTIGTHWAKMSKMIPGRTDNGIKNRFHNLRRQLEREDEHRLRLSAAADFPQEIRLDRVRDYPETMRGRADDLWNMGAGIGVLAAQSVLGGGITRNSGRFGPYKTPETPEVCVRCGLLVPSVHTGNEICTKTGWCQSCIRIPPHVTGNLLRECLNLRRAPELNKREIIESWEELFTPTKKAKVEEDVKEDVNSDQVKEDAKLDPLQEDAKPDPLQEDEKPAQGERREVEATPADDTEVQKENDGGSPAIEA